MSNNWSDWTDFETVQARAGGRRHYNAVRKVQRFVRQERVFELLILYGWFEWGTLSRIARELGVSRSVICRDRQDLIDLGACQTCPHCFKKVPPRTVQVVTVSGVPVRTVKQGKVKEHQPVGRHLIRAASELRALAQRKNLTEDDVWLVAEALEAAVIDLDQLIEKAGVRVDSAATDTAPTSTGEPIDDRA